MDNPSLTTPILSSIWDGLSPHLIARFWPVERVGSSREWQRVKDSPTVQAVLIDSNLEMTLGWQSPFENAGADKGMPTLSAMLQSGAIQPFVDSKSSTGKFLESFEGRTGITKLNSTQVFSGMPPIRIQVSALFRAWRNAASEVEAPVNQLVNWALPQELASDGPILTLLAGIKTVAQGKPLDEAAAKSVLPSLAPAKIAMKYKGRIYSPLVIESIGLPLSSPVDANGKFVELVVPMTLCSLTAIDRRDWGKTTGFTA